ncbi:MAG TPA: bifunctional DNA primase/polymerase [Rhodanobacter sp.]|nr:bifunctional DNA primase/polymerase [Rhodanobacter sp.]
MANSLLEAALAYAARGWPIFPCDTLKHPRTTNGVMDATTDTITIREWWDRWPRANIGLDVGGAGMMVVDVDAYKPAFDQKAFTELQLPETKLTQKSPRGGTHYFFELAEGEIVSNDATGKLAPCCDVRSFHGYVLLAPSATADGPYVWQGEGKPSYRADEMVRRANSHREKSAARDEWIIAADLPENVAACAAWLAEKAKPAIKGQGGNSIAYATAAMCKSFGISEATAFDLMWEHWRSRCTPVWYSEETLETVIEHGYRYNTSPPGNMTAAYKVAKSASLFSKAQEVPSEGQQLITPDGRFRFVDRDGMAAIKPPSWLLENFLPSDAYAMLFGAPGTFKSFLALDMALSIVTGIPSDPVWNVVRPGNVLYAAGEGRSHIAARVAAWEEVHWNGQRAQGIVLGDPVPNVAEDWQAFIDGALALSPEGYALTIIDTAGTSLAGENEGAFESASLFTRKVRGLTMAFGGAVLAIHHVGHDAKGRPIGSTAFLRDPDTLVSVTREGKQMVVAVSMVKQRDHEEWTKPHMVALKGARDSLVAVKTSTPPPAPKAPKDDAKILMEQSAVDKVVERAIREELSKNRAGAYSMLQFATILAMREDIEVGSEMLRRHILPRLYQANGTYASKAYHPENKPADRWRWYTE